MQFLFFQSFYQMSLVTVFCRATWPISSFKFTKNGSVGLYSLDAFAISPGAAIGAELVLCCDCEINRLSWYEICTFFVWLAGAFLLLACARCYCKAHVEPFDGSLFNSSCVDSSNSHKPLWYMSWKDNDCQSCMCVKISKYVSYVLCV